MGDRGQVHIVDTGVWLYTHWDGSELPDTVALALAMKERWDDEEYLARIIFDEMIGDQQGGSTGFGIGTKQHGDVATVVAVNCKNQEVIVSHPGFDQDWDKVEPEIKEPFENFIARVVAEELGHEHGNHEAIRKAG